MIDHGEGYVSVQSECKIFSPTMNLRWSKEGKLQQAWQEHPTGEVEWRDIEMEAVGVEPAPANRFCASCTDS
jgi:hypothetical protein